MKLIRCFDYKILLLFVASVISFFFLSYFSNLAYDDFNYKFIYDKEGLTTERIGSIHDILISQYNHYYVHSGRVLIHSVVQFFLMFENKVWFDLANAIVFGLFQILIILNSSIQKQYFSIILYLLFLQFLWFVIPGHNYCMMWLSGSVNYLWSTTLTLALLYILNKTKSNEIYSKRYVSFFFLVGFLLNATHEVISIPLSIAFIFYIVSYSGRLNKSSLTLISGAIVGTVFIAVSPANFRVALATNLSGEYSVQTLIMSNESHILIALVAVKIFVFLSLAGLFLLLFNRKLFWSQMMKNQLLLIAIVVSLGFAYFVNAFSNELFFRHLYLR